MNEIMSAVATLPIPVLVIDNTGRIIYKNKTLASSKHFLRRKDLCNLLSEADLQRYLILANASGEADIFKFKLGTKSAVFYAVNMPGHCNLTVLFSFLALKYNMFVPWDEFQARKINKIIRDLVYRFIDDKITDPVVLCSMASSEIACFCGIENNQYRVKNFLLAMRLAIRLLKCNDFLETGNLSPDCDEMILKGFSESCGNFGYILCNLLNDKIKNIEIEQCGNMLELAGYEKGFVIGEIKKCAAVRAVRPLVYTKYDSTIALCVSIAAELCADSIR